MGFAGIKRLVLMSEHSNLDVDLRYLPVLRFLKKCAPDGTVLEIGSGYLGISPYVQRTVVGADMSFPGTTLPNLLPVIARGVLPFRNRAFPAVISLDTLEHVPREQRQLFVDEALRIAERYVIVGFPEGEDAELHDARMEKYYTGQQGEAHSYFVEHREYRIPRREEVVMYLERAKRRLSREFSVRRVNNVNILLREIFMKLAWHRRKTIQRTYVMLTLLAHLDRLFSFGRQYRSIYFITLKNTSDAL